MNDSNPRIHEERLRAWIDNHAIQAELVRFETSCHSVDDAVAATGVPVDAIVKNICMIGADGCLIVAILPGAARASTSRVGKALGQAPPRIATPEEAFGHSGYPVGGTPSFGYDATFLVDPRVLEQPMVYTGGGSDRALVRVTPDDLVRANGARIARVRK